MCEEMSLESSYVGSQMEKTEGNLVAPPPTDATIDIPPSLQDIPQKCIPDTRRDPIHSHASHCVHHIVHREPKSQQNSRRVVNLHLKSGE